MLSKRRFQGSCRLQDMTLEELWELFPVVLKPHIPLWKEWAHEEMELLGHLLTRFNPVINHIGSTAIPDIMAKPIVDILVEMPENVAWSAVKERLEARDYICMAENDRRISFNKGYTTEGYGERVSHIHCHRIGDNDEILFRDYLIAHPDAAKEYEQLKLSLLPQYIYDRDGYTQAKSVFIYGIRHLALSKSKA